MQPGNEALAARQGQDRRVSHAPVYASPLSYLAGSESEPPPRALPVSLTAPAVASTARPTPVAAMPTAVLATVTTAHPPRRALASTMARSAVREIERDGVRDIGKSWYSETSPILRISCNAEVSLG
jgi:hypothetical protein